MVSRPTAFRISEGTKKKVKGGASLVGQVQRKGVKLGRKESGGMSMRFSTKKRRRG